MLKDYFSFENPLLIAVAAYPEVCAVLRGLRQPTAKVERNVWQTFRIRRSYVTVLQMGVGKSNCAALAVELTKVNYSAVISVGISGSYGPLPMGAIVLGDRTVMADEGITSSSGFENIEDRGWGLTRFNIAPQPWHRMLGAQYQGTLLTVSTISGTRELARDYAQRDLRAIAEDMETASLALVCEQFGVPLTPIRIISNECGDPNSWNVQLGFAKLEELVRGWGLTEM